MTAPGAGPPERKRRPGQGAPSKISYTLKDNRSRRRPQPRPSAAAIRAGMDFLAPRRPQ
jgi:hypothetical protein